MAEPIPKASVLDTAYKAVRDLKVDDDVGRALMEEFVDGYRAAGGIDNFDEAKRKAAADKAYDRATKLITDFSGITVTRTVDPNNPFARGAEAEYKAVEDQIIKARLGGMTRNGLRMLFIRNKATNIGTLAGNTAQNVENAMSGLYIAGLSDEDKNALAQELVAKAKSYGVSEELDPQAVRANLAEQFYRIIEGPRKSAATAAKAATKLGSIDDLVEE